MGVRQIAGSDGESLSVPVASGTSALCTAGCLEVTDRVLDVAIDGDGFFAARAIDGSIGSSVAFDRRARSLASTCQGERSTQRRITRASCPRTA